MTAEMLTAVGALVVAVGSIISAVLMHRKSTALLVYRMEVVEKKMDSLSSIPTDIALIKKDISFLKENQ